MAKFKFRLATYLRLREWVRDQRQSQLAQAYRADQVILQEGKRLEEESAGLVERMRQAAGPGPLHVDRLLDAQRYQLVLRAQQHHLQQQHELVKTEIQRRRHALVEANRDVQVLERLRSRQHCQHRYQENRQQIRQLDEIGQCRVVEEETS